MRADGDRKKKLIVAFHFQFANRAGGDCDACRKNGLEVKRRCGFLAPENRAEPRTVWARKRTRTEECPKSLVTGESLALLEEFFVRRRLRMVDGMDTPARKVDAFLILREEMEREERDGTSSKH